MEDQDMITMIAHTHIEVTFIEPLTSFESFAIVAEGERTGLDISVTTSGRIALFETEEIEEVTSILADIGAIETIALIKVISTFEPQLSTILIEFEEGPANDNNS